jgi:hypothetical protein
MDLKAMYVNQSEPKLWNKKATEAHQCLQPIPLHPQESCLNAGLTFGKNPFKVMISCPWTLCNLGPLV